MTSLHIANVPLNFTNNQIGFIPQRCYTDAPPAYNLLPSQNASFSGNTNKMIGICKKIKKSFRLICCNVHEICVILSSFNIIERNKIVIYYSANYGQDLRNVFLKKIRGLHRDILYTLTLSRNDVIAHSIHSCFRIFSSDIDFVIDILTLCSNQEIQYLILTYKQNYNMDLKVRLKKNLEKSGGRLIHALCQGIRNDCDEPNEIQNDIEAIHNATSKLLFKNWGALIPIFSLRSWNHLSMLSTAYKNKHGVNFEVVIEKCPYKQLFKTLINIVSIARSKSNTFAKMINRHILNVDLDHCMKFILFIDEKELFEINQSYYNLYKKYIPQHFMSVFSDKSFQTIVINLFNHSNLTSCNI